MRPKPLAERHPSDIVGLEELAEHWRKPASSIVSDRVRAPWRVPPTCSPEGARPLRFRVGTILAFDAAAEEKSCRARRELLARRDAPKLPKQRGRPKKAQALARRNAEAAPSAVVATRTAEASP